MARPRPIPAIPSPIRLPAGRLARMGIGLHCRRRRRRRPPRTSRGSRGPFPNPNPLRPLRFLSPPHRLRRDSRSAGAPPSQFPMVIQTCTSIFADVFSKDYKRGIAKMSQEEVKNMRTDQRIKLYKLICFCGTGLITCMDKSALLNKLSVYDHAAAYKCILYFTFSLLCMLLGIIASSFPESAPYAMEVSWNGSLQAFLFVIACLHLSVMEYYAGVQQMFASFVLTSTVFSLL